MLIHSPIPIGTCYKRAKTDFTLLAQLLIHELSHYGAYSTQTIGFTDGEASTPNHGPYTHRFDIAAFCYPNIELEVMLRKFTLKIMRVQLSVFLLCLALVCSCGKQNRIPSIRTLPMDSSLAIIMEATELLTDSCVPSCWPRDFSTKKIAAHYTGYVLQNRTDQRIRGIHPTIRLGSDTSFYSLIDYAYNVDLQEIIASNVHSLSNQRVTMELTDGLKGRLSDDKLGFITVSPVTINKQVNQAVFFYEQYGDGFSSWIVCARRKQNRWVIVSKKRLSIS